MKRALTLLSLMVVLAGCASKDGFIDNSTEECRPGSPVGLEVGWDTQQGMERGVNRAIMSVRVSNNSDEDITVKRIYVDPHNLFDDDAPFKLERGAAEPNQLIPEAEASTFEVPMVLTYNYERRTSRATSVDVNVGALLESGTTVRCRFRLPMPAF